MEISYTKQKTNTEFNWHEFLDYAIENTITIKDFHNALEKSSKWVTCAVGSQCSVIPRADNGEPIDFKLRDLGIRFDDFIRGTMYRDAKKILIEIEQRSAILIQRNTI